MAIQTNTPEEARLLELYRRINKARQIIVLAFMVQYAPNAPRATDSAVTHDR
jgi:hypothetical protein